MIQSQKTSINFFFLLSRFEIQGKLRRRIKLRDKWFFECCCPRCKDPFENGSNGSTLLCQSTLNDVTSNDTTLSNTMSNDKAKLNDVTLKDVTLNGNSFNDLTIDNSTSNDAVVKCLGNVVQEDWTKVDADFVCQKCRKSLTHLEVLQIENE
jgi:hypothetical protein